LQAFISAYFQWKKTARQPLPEVVHFDFTELAALFNAEQTFYKVGVSAEEARPVLDEQLAHLREMARFFFAHVSASVLEDGRALTNRAFVEGIDLSRFRFDPAELRERFAACEDSAGQYEWSFDPRILTRFNTPRAEEARPAPPVGDAAALVGQEVA
jgi:hypothetical protein